MTLTLPLTQDQEARLQAEAQQSGLPLSEYALRRLLGGLLDAPIDESARLAAIDEAFGAFADVPFSSEELAREKQEELAREDARMQGRP